MNGHSPVRQRHGRTEHFLAYLGHISHYWSELVQLMAMSYFRPHHTQDMVLPLALLTGSSSLKRLARMESITLGHDCLALLVCASHPWFLTTILSHIPETYRTRIKCRERWYVLHAVSSIGDNMLSHSAGSLVNKLWSGHDIKQRWVADPRLDINLFETCHFVVALWWPQ